MGQDIKSVTIGGTRYLLPYVDLVLYPEYQLADLAMSVATHGVREPIVASKAKSRGKDIWVVDGAHRVINSAELNKGNPPVRFVEFQDDADELTYAEETNTARRQLTDRQKELARQERVERINEMREAGASIRAIAEEVGVSTALVQQALFKSGVNPPIHVTGRDGKSYKKRKKQKKARAEPAIPEGAPSRIKDVMGSADKFSAAATAMKTAATKLRDMEESAGYKAMFEWEQNVQKKLNRTKRVYSSDFHTRASAVLAMKPVQVCPECKGVEASQDADLCTKCKGRGFLVADEVEAS